MPFEELEDVTSADIALRIFGGTVGELFVSAGEALRAVMLGGAARRAEGMEISFELRAESIEMLLFSFLNELLFHKDSSALLVSPTVVDVDHGPGGASLRCAAVAERIEPALHDFIVDIKAVTMHRFSVCYENGAWTATVVFDV
ncbi:MAG TPA: archease [Spirochaetota bacterium]|nr:archease [Spirochaetota bacterium]